MRSLSSNNRVGFLCLSVQLSLSLVFGLGLANSTIGQTATLEAPAKDSQEASEQGSSTWAPDPEALERISNDIQFMASDEMGGRKPGTPGIVLCEEFIVKQFEKAGINPGNNGSYFQELEVPGPRRMSVETTSLTLTGPAGPVELKLGENYQQLTSTVDNISAESELVFVGYGITAEDHNYDDYANIDVAGKIVVMLRMEPQQENDDSVFNGAKNTRHSSGRIKADLARRNGAAAVLFVNDSQTAPDDQQDELVDVGRFGRTLCPFAHVKRSVIEEILKTSPLIDPTGKKLYKLSAAEALIDSNLEPISQPIRDWKASIESTFAQSPIKTKNIIGVIEGEGPLADETIVIGGHYDHLGLGGFGSNAPGRKEIHNGADDNATGTAAVIELARRFAKAGKKPARRLVFICFTAEEMGLLGANYYVENPIYPLENTVAMINFDMIGWLREDRLTLYGWNTSAELSTLFDKANEGIGLDLFKPEQGFGGSDHLPFDARKIPNTFIHSGTNNVYHTPEDDFALINCEGALKVIDYSEKLVAELAAVQNRPKYGRPKPYRFGVRLQENRDEEQVIVRGVTRNSIARTSGVQPGDIIVEFAGEEITSRRQVTRLVRKFKGEKIKLKVIRGEDTVELDADMTLPE